VTSNQHPELIAALSRVIDPELRLPITELGMVGDAQLLTDAGGHRTAEATIKLTVVGCPAAQRIEADALAALASVVGASQARVQMTVMNTEERAALKEKLRAGKPARVNPFDATTLTRVLLVGSGKGGVGKSSVTANLAVALAEAGHRVGLIDADIFGFSTPGQLGLGNAGDTVKPTRIDEMILPPVAFGVKVISIGMFLDGNKPVAWRGPMLHRAVEQFLTDVFWGDLDFLLVDLPPGTGDIAISLGQLLPTAKTVVVTTPQIAAAEVAERSGSVGLQTGQSVAGVIENMAWLEQPDGSKLELFGSGGGLAVANRLAELQGSPVAVLGQIPISIPLREGSDQGQPVVLSSPEDPAAKAICEVAEKLASAPMGLVGKRLKLNL
jgi:ATP-binding protein involved in chromosome partitioning